MIHITYYNYMIPYQHQKRQQLQKTLNIVYVINQI